MSGMFSDLKKLEQQPVERPARELDSHPLARPSSLVTSPIPRNRGTADTRNSTSAEERKRTTVEVRSAVALDTGLDGSPAEFDLGVHADKPHGFLWTEQELWALEDVKKDLQRRYGISTSMQELIRCALHFLVEDYRRQGGQSFAIRHISNKRK